jgi:hypothetical protein
LLAGGGGGGGGGGGSSRSLGNDRVVGKLKMFLAALEIRNLCTLVCYNAIHYLLKCQSQYSGCVGTIIARHHLPIKVTFAPSHGSVKSSHTY